MKSITLLLSVGLVSAVNLATPVVQSGTAVDPNVIANNSASAVNNSGVNVDPNIINGENGINGINLGGLNNGNLNLNGLNLGNLNLGGLNLGSIDLSNQNDIANALLQMFQLLCLNNQFNLNDILGLGQNQDLELFLELAQLMQLEQLGFLNSGGIVQLLQSGLVGGNSFNFGVFKREVTKARKTMKRSQLRRSKPVRRQAGCQPAAVVGGAANAGAVTVQTTVTVGAGAAATVAPAVATVASAAPAVVATAAASVAAAPVAATVVAAPPAAEPTAAAAAAPAAGDEPLSDFTR